MCKIITEKEFIYQTDSFVPKLTGDNTFCEKAKVNKSDFLFVIKMFDQILKRSNGERRRKFDELECLIK